MIREISLILVSWKDEEDTLDAIASYAAARARVAAEVLRFAGELRG